jgi:uncharacterized protein YbcI
MDPPERTAAQRIATAAAEFERRRTGRAPHAVTVVLGGETLVVTLHGVLSPAERALAVTPTGAAELQAYRSRLLDTSAAAFRQEIKEITGVEVREAAAELEPTTGTVVTVFTTGTVVQVYLLAGGVAADTWSGGGPVPHP